MTTNLAEIIPGRARRTPGDRGALTHDSLATVICTSGTTGCPLTHGNFPAEVTSVIEMREAVAAANATVSSKEATRHIRVLPVDLTEASGHLTPTVKLTRAVVGSDFAADVDAVCARRVGS